VIAQSEAFFNRWGVWAVFFARFVPPVRAFVPVTAGALGMLPSRFYAVNIPAILVWAPAHVLPGVLAISALHQYGGIPRHFGLKHYWIVTVVAAALIIAIAGWALRRWHGDGVEPAAQSVKK
jgi:membrane-associated protein